MLDEKELDAAVAAISDFRHTSKEHHENLAVIVKQYTTLLEDYRRLKSDFEEERESRERYKQMARGQERNPFVLVLIDGDGYVFDDDLVSNGAEGGQRAAALLNDSVKSSLRNRGLEHCRVMVRVYANLAGLSRALSKSKLAGPEKRSLAPFTASFTRSNDLFDFVDAGELKETADFKIRAMFRQFVENAQCRHIYFACCHDVGYLSELTPYVGSRDRITLVRTPTFHHEFSRLGIRVEDFPNIFRTTPLDGQASIFNTKAPATKQEEQTIPVSPVEEDTAPLCQFFQKGICKYGKTCHNLHVKANTNGNGTSLADIRDWRQNSNSNANKAYPMSQLNKSDHDFMRSNSKHGATLPPVDAQQLRLDFSTRLPKEDDIPPNHIAINYAQHRLDAYIPPPTPEGKAGFQARISVRKLCNNQHILGSCAKGGQCEYDHNPISPAILNCLKQVALNNPCPRKGACRSPVCQHGHICQKVDCMRRGGKVYCKFPIPAHTQPLEAVEYVSGIGGMREETEDVRTKNSSSPVLSSVAGGEMHDIDSEEEAGQGKKGQGALLDLEDEDGTSLD